MQTEPSGWGDGWALSLRVWAERRGESVLGPGRLELLEHVDRHQSISAAARQMRMSYRRAWELVQAINSAAGRPLVTAQTGGHGGGGAALTPFGRQAVKLFRSLTERLTRTAGELVRQSDTHILHLLAAVSLEEPVGRLLTDYALVRPDLRVRSIFAASDELANLIRGGASADVFLTADPKILDRLPAKPARRIPLVENTLAVIAPHDSSLLAARPATLLRQSRLRIAAAAAGCPLGGYTEGYLSHSKIGPLPEERVIRAENSRGVVTAVRSGQSDIGIVYASDAAQADGCRILCGIDRLPTPIRYEAAALGPGAIDLVEFLSSPVAATRFRECGFRPVRKPGDRSTRTR
jgi:molybdate transport system regulatory protein